MKNGSGGGHLSMRMWATICAFAIFVNAPILRAGCPQFNSPAIYNSGLNAPSAMVVADFDNDGRLDVATAYIFAGSIEILLQSPDGTFSFFALFGVLGAPTSLVAADFNRDGKMDLAAGTDSNNVIIFLGNGDGTFTLSSNFGVSDSPQEMTVLDFNRDGIPDIAFTTASGNNVTVLFGDGAGGVASTTTFNAGTNFPGPIISGDFNGDGNPDVAVASPFLSRVAVAMGNGTGGVASTASYSVSGPVSLAAADFDRDGKPDIIVGTSSSVTMLLNNGAGAFTAGSPVAINSNSNYRSHLAVADFNGDGKPDLLYGGVSGNNDMTAVMFGDGAGGFTGQTLYMDTGVFSSGSISVAAADMNNDGRPDIVGAHSGAGTVRVITNASVCNGNCATFKDDARRVSCEARDDGRSSRRRGGPDEEHSAGILQRGVERFGHGKVAGYDVDGRR
jgi:hypothetical protein